MLLTGNQLINASDAVYLSNGLSDVGNLPLRMTELPGVKLNTLENGDVIIERSGISITIHQSDIRNLASAIGSFGSLRLNRFVSR